MIVCIAIGVCVDEGTVAIRVWVVTTATVELIVDVVVAAMNDVCVVVAVVVPTGVV